MLHPIRLDSPGPRLGVVEDLPPSVSEQYPDEAGRWLFWLSMPALSASIFIGLGIGTSFSWLYGGAVVIGPFGVVAAFIYLAMSSDINGRKGRAPRRVLHAAPIPAAAAHA